MPSETLDSAAVTPQTQSIAKDRYRSSQQASSQSGVSGGVIIAAAVGAVALAATCVGLIWAQRKEGDSRRRRSSKRPAKTSSSKQSYGNRSRVSSRSSAVSASQPKAAAEVAESPAAATAEAASSAPQGSAEQQQAPAAASLAQATEDGEAVVLVDEAGNVVDAEGNVLGRVSDLEGEEEGEEEGGGPLSPEEAQAEQLTLQATTMWREGKRAEAMQVMREALAVVQGGGARAGVIAEVASSLADMLYAQQEFEEAQGVVQTAMANAEEAGHHELLIKLSNNLGAVLRKLNRLEEAKVLHQRAMETAISNLGHSHAYAHLARGNLVEAMDELGEVEEARQLIRSFLDVLLREAEQLEAAGHTLAPPGDKEDGEEEELVEEEDALDPLKAAKLGAVRAYVELGRLEVKHSRFAEAEEAFNAANAICDKVYGPDAPESASVVASLASCHRNAGNISLASELYERLYDMTETANGPANQNTVMLARTLTEVFEEMGMPQHSVNYAERALAGMQAMLGLEVHPYLEPFFTAIINAKVKAGDPEGAEAVKKEYLRGMMRFQQAAMAGKGGPGRGGPAGRRGGRPGRRSR